MPVVVPASAPDPVSATAEALGFSDGIQEHGFVALPFLGSSRLYHREQVQLVRLYLGDALLMAEPSRQKRYARELLSDAEQKRAASLYSAHAKTSFVSGRALLRTALTKLQREVEPREWPLLLDEHGKPWLDTNVSDSLNRLPPPTRPARAKAERLEVSITHTAGLIACAVAQGVPVGIDAEETEREVSWTSIARRFFAPEEIESLFALPRAMQRTRFFRLWTAKEAFLKAHGVGLSASLSSFALEFSEVEARVLRPGRFPAVLGPYSRRRHRARWVPVARHGSASAYPPALAFPSRSSRDTKADGAGLNFPCQTL